MTARPARIVDSHVHLWDPANTEWYPYLSGRQQLNMGDTTGMQRLFDAPTYRRESEGWNVVALVNVAAATGLNSIEETLAMDAKEGVAAIVGGLPPTDTVEDAIALLDTQLQAKRLRGVRPMGQFKEPLPAEEVLRALAERNLVFEVMTHTDQLVDAARGLAGHDALTVVVEHTGWPTSSSDAEFLAWKTGIDALANAGDNVVCKLSGLAMPLGAMSVDAFRPWVEHALGAFGANRCMFASNFPVDGMHGSLDQLLTVMSELVPEDDHDAVFAATAERVYRL